MSKAAELAALIANVNKGSSLANKNFIINGNMNVAQRGTSTTGLGGNGASYNTADRFCHSLGNTAGRFTSAIIADGPSGFANCLKLSCTTADTSVAATEYFQLQHRIEGQNLQPIAKGTADAKPITASFYVKGNASATYTAELYDYNNDRQISKTFSVTTSWSRVELTFPADTSGALTDDNALSMLLTLHLHAGSNFTSGTFNSSSWASSTLANRVSSSNTSFFDSTSRTFFLTGVQLEIGEKATAFEHEPYDTTLKKASRYYTEIARADNNTCHLVGYVQATTVARFGFDVSMRTSPTITETNFGILYSTGSEQAVTGVEDITQDNQFVSFKLTTAANLNVGEAVVLYSNGAATLTFDAEI